MIVKALTERERLLILRDFIKTVSPEHFIMNTWDCKSAACIGGWAERLFSADQWLTSRQVGALIGLSKDQSERLFFMYDCGTNMDAVKKPHALAVLNILIETGEVDWDAAFEQVEADARG